jgi:DNA mismatch repair ATPase MutS
MLEMKETAFICNNASTKSLILLDELGRATSNEDGVAIAWSVSEYLLSKNSMTFFVTHYPQLCRLSNVYPSVQNQHLQAAVSRDENGGISYTHKVSPGPCNVASDYGVEMASSCGWPADVLHNVSLYSAAGTIIYVCTNQIHSMRRRNRSSRWCRKSSQRMDFARSSLHSRGIRHFRRSGLSRVLLVD